jgi:hypothetical protein
MMDEMTCAFDSPGGVLMILMIVLLTGDPELGEGQTRITNNGNAPHGYLRCRLLRTGWLRSPYRYKLPAASPDNENARAVPI